MNDLEQLKELLFGAEKEALDSIAERVERREIRTADVADILPEAIYQSHRKDSELVDSLSQPVGDCLKREFRDDPQTYGDALYPVMGPAIRKSIMHALRTYAQQINEAVEHSISPKGLKWRWQASRAGVPFGDYLLQKTLRYRVEQAYLISRENGLLVGHVHHTSSKIKDSDAVSAMFTAIQDFVKESFSPDRTGRLESADMGDFTLWAVHGPHALLVCVIRGVPPRSLRGDLSAILERIHFRYGEAIRDYKGDTSTIPDVETELERCLQFEAREEGPESKKRRPVFLIVLALLLVAAGTFFLLQSWWLTNQMKELEAALETAPGIHLTELTRDGDSFRIRGLRDPLAANIVDVAAGLDIPADRLSVTTEPFQSLEPQLIAARAGRLLDAPESVTLAVRDSTLLVSGDAPWSWQQELQAGFGSVAGVESLDISGLSAADRERFASRAAALATRRFFFERGTEFREDDAEKLTQHAAQLIALAEAATDVGYDVAVSVQGSVDALGDTQANIALAERRAAAAAAILASAGIAARIVPPQDLGLTAGEPVEDFSKRFVEISLQARPVAMRP